MDEGGVMFLCCFDKLFEVLKEENFVFVKDFKEKGFKYMIIMLVVNDVNFG